MALSEEQLQTLGISSQHIVFDVLPPGVDQPVHRALIEPFMALKKKRHWPVSICVLPVVFVPSSDN